MFGRAWVAKWNATAAYAATSAASSHALRRRLSGAGVTIGSRSLAEPGDPGGRNTRTRDPKTWGVPAQIAILAASSLFGLAAVLSSLEGLFALALRAEPVAASSEVWRRARREYYMRYERQIVQYLPECAQFDPQLAYRLKPGRCRFANREYAIELAIDSAGLRDREDALAAPRIVVTGDSFAVGWGVAQDETVSAVLAAQTGEKTLDAAQPSYGTARELLLVQRLDLSAAYALVIQYCENDFVENGRFLQADGRLATMGRPEDQALAAAHR